MGTVRLMVLMHNPPRCLPHLSVVSRMWDSRQGLPMGHVTTVSDNPAWMSMFKIMIMPCSSLGVRLAEQRLAPPVLSQQDAGCLMRLWANQ